MKIDPISAATKAQTRRRSPCCSMAAAVPTSTGAIAAGSVRGRAAISQILKSGPLRVLGEVRAASLLVGVAALLALLRHVEEQSRIVGELLDAGEPILSGVEARLEQPQGEGREGGHLAAPRNRLAFELGEWEHRVDEPHVERLLRVIQPGEEPDLLRLLDADVARQERGAEAAIEAADPRSGLTEDGVVAGDGQVADEMEDVPAADRVARDHRHHRLRKPPDLNMEVPDVEPPDPLLRHLVVADVAVVAPDPLVATRAEGLGPSSGEDDRGHLHVIPGAGEGIAQLGEGGWAERVVDLGPVDRDLRD